jgi:hypothetical protein
MSKMADIVLVVLPEVAATWLDRKTDSILVEALNPQQSQRWHHRMQRQSHDRASRNDGNLRMRVDTRWKSHFYKPTLEPAQVCPLCPLFPHHPAAKTRVNVVRHGLRKNFPQMSFHACTHDMLRVGCHAGMLGGQVERPANAETLHL